MYISKMEIAATVRTELALSGLYRAMSILEENFRDVKTAEEMKPLKDFIEYKIEPFIREAKSDDLIQLMPLLEELQAAALEMEDLLDLYEYEQIEKQVNSSSEPLPKEKVLPTHLRNGLDKLLMAVQQVENKRQSITSKTGTTQSQADTVTPTMEMAAKAGTELALSGLFRVVSILDENFRDVKTTDEMKPLNDFVDYKIDALIREANSDDLAQLMPSLEELQAAALEMEDQLDLYEYDQIEIHVSSSSSEPIPKEKVLPKDLRDGLNKLLKSVERVENTRKPIASKTGTTQSGSFIDFLVGESHVARPAIELALSDTSRAIEMLGSNFRGDIIIEKILEQLKDVVSYHIEALIRNVNSDDLAQSMQLLEELLETASLDPDQFSPYEHYYTQEYDSTKEELEPILFKSPLRIGLETLLKFVEQIGKKQPSIKARKCKTKPQANTINPTSRTGVKKWLKFVEQMEKEHPFISSTKDTTHPQAYTITPISTTFFPSRGFLSTTSLENVKCQEDAEEIMRNHKNNLREIIFGWTDIANSTDTCKEVLERLEPDQNLRSLSITRYSCAKFPNWMLKGSWLPSLQSLRLQCCRSLKIVPFLPPCLHQLYVCDCDELMQLPPLSDTLCTLHLVDCPKLMVSLMFNKSLGLDVVRLENCSRNESWLFIDISFLTNLKVLILARFPNLQTLACSNPALTNLRIEDCPKLTSMVNIQGCTSLQSLEIFKCPMLRREEASLVEGVVEGDIANRLSQVDSIDTDEPLLVLKLLRQKAFSSLRYLNLYAFQRPFPPMLHEYFHQFSSLTSLTLEGFTTLPNLEKLSSLERFQIYKCPDVESLPELPVSVQRLWIDRSPKLKEKYGKGGPLRNTISHIPIINICPY